MNDFLITAYIADNYPETLQIPHPGLPFVTLCVEDSEHYLISPENTSTSEDRFYVDAEWASLFPCGDSFIRPATHGRQFTISMFHQLHCINNIRLALARRPLPLAHIHHCMNYLRQMILCASNMQLEPLSRRLMEKSNLMAVDGLGLTHMCRDWSMVYRIFEDQYKEWENSTST